MGSSLIARCKCGFASETFMVGGGMLNHETTCYVPGICLNCHRFVVANYLAKRPRCPKCRRKVTFYNDPSLQAPSGKKKSRKEPVFEWHLFPPHASVLLPDTRYLCPECGKMEMRFEFGGILWD